MNIYLIKKGESSSLFLQGVFWAMIAGFIVGLIRFALEFSFSAPACGSLELDTRPDWVITWVSNFHYLHFGTFLFFFTMIVAVMISYLTEPIPDSKLVRLTYWTRFSSLPRDEGKCQENASAAEVNESNRSTFFSAGKCIIDDKLTGSALASSLAENFTGMKKVIFTLCGVSQKDLDTQDNRVESRQLSAEQEAEELARFLKEDKKLKRFVFCFFTRTLVLLRALLLRACLLTRTIFCEHAFYAHAYYAHVNYAHAYYAHAYFTRFRNIYEFLY